MTPNEKSMIEELFGRIRQTAMPARDSEAERLIAEEMARTPGAAYALAQTVLVQDQALRQAADQVRTLQEAAQRQQAGREDAPQSGSFADRFGGPGGPRPGAVPRTGQPAGPEAASPPPQSGGFGGGGFLSGALQTAAGVAGGALLFEGVRSLFGGGGLGSGPWGGSSPTINETIINEASDKSADKSRDDNSRDANYDDGLQQADYSDDDGDDPGDDGWSDDGFDADDSI
jgi:uncharacterized protein